MKNAKLMIVGSALLFTTAGCAAYMDGRSPGYIGALDTHAQKDPALVRAEEDQLTPANWREVETFLSEQGYNPGAVDGSVTRQTREAIANFQQYQNLYTTGLLNDHTLIEMARKGADFSGSLGVQMRRADSNPTTIP